MRLERITARDARSATEQVLARFGPDALIVSNQRVDGMTELIVAVDVEAAEAAEAPEAIEAPETAQGKGRGARAVDGNAGSKPSFGDTLLRTGASLREDLSQREGVTQATSQSTHSTHSTQSTQVRPGGIGGAGAPAEPPRSGPRMIETRTVEPRAPSRLSPQLPHSLLPRRSGPITHAEVEHWLSPVPGVEGIGGPGGIAGIGGPGGPSSTPSSGAPASDASLTPAPAGLEQQLRAREIVDLVRAEFAVMRRELMLAQQVDTLQSGAGLPAHVRELADAMAETGVPVGLKTLLIDEIRASTDRESALEAIRERLEQSLPDAAPSELQRGVQVLMGPSGCGKTTLAARLVARHAAVHGPENVALVSYDDPRPGAWSQLQMLAARTGVDCFRAQSPEALATVLGELAGRLLVVIDTASQNLAERRAGIERATAQASFNLVLPADASIATVQRHFAGQPSPLSHWQCLLLTKLDEASHPWPLLQALCNRPLPLGLASDSPQARDAAQPIRARDLVFRAIAGLTHTMAAGTRNMWDGSSVSTGAPAPATESVHAN